MTQYLFKNLRSERNFQPVEMWLFHWTSAAAVVIVLSRNAWTQTSTRRSMTPSGAPLSALGWKEKGQGLLGLPLALDVSKGNSRKHVGNQMISYYHDNYLIWQDNIFNNNNSSILFIYNMFQYVSIIRIDTRPYDQLLSPWIPRNGGGFWGGCFWKKQNTIYLFKCQYLTKPVFHPWKQGNYISSL